MKLTTIGCTRAGSRIIPQCPASSVPIRSSSRDVRPGLEELDHPAIEDVGQSDDQDERRAVAAAVVGDVDAVHLDVGHPRSSFVGGLI
jgi:hypothetical protein